MPSVIITEAARADVVRLRAFLREHSPQAAFRLGHTLADAFDLLARSPRLGRPVESVAGLHRLVIPFGAGGYVLHYRYHTDANALHVLRIRHSRENGNPPLE